MCADDDLIISKDKLRGAAEIGEFLGEPEARVRWLIRHKQIPYGREGSLIIASRRMLREHYLKAVGGNPK